MSAPQPRLDAAADPEDLTEYLERLLQTERLRKSPSLRQLLEYLVRKCAEGLVDEIKESTIAMDVFGRPSSFDSRLDNIVRVQAHRLRKTLEGYYQAEGAHDAFRITIPKGSYVPSVERHQEDLGYVPGTSAAGSKSESIALPAAPATRRRRLAWAAFAGVFLAGVLTSAVAFRVAPAWLMARRAPAGREDLRTLPLAAVWGGMLRPDFDCVISFTNPVFLSIRTPRSHVLLPYSGPLSAPAGTPLNISPGDPNIDPRLIQLGSAFVFGSGWTGTGEVFSVFRLTRLFTEAGRPLKVIRGRALTFDAMREANVIFLGSPWANELQDKVNPGQTPLVCNNTGQIINSNPRPGEQASYTVEADPGTQALTVSYSLVSVLPGITPGTRIVSSAGLDTYGTSAGIEFLTSAAGVTALLERLDPARRRTLPDFFQAVIRTGIVRDDPANLSLVLAREVKRAGVTASRDRP
jgi:hypothetical protein